MFHNPWARRGLILFTVFFLLSILAIDAWARIGGGRSFGSRGSRTYTIPRSTPAPSPVNPYQGTRQYGAPGQPAPSNPAGGGFLRGMAGGIAGGLLGGMLFRSLGFAGGAGNAGGGIGLMDLILVGALLYGVYWFVKRRRTAESPSGLPGIQHREASAPVPEQGVRSTQPYGPGAQENGTGTGLRHLRQMDPAFDDKAFADECMDLFFRIQGAWANRDMAGVRDILTDEMFERFNTEARQLKVEKRINRLENIAVRSAEIVEIWQENGEDFITVEICANLLDYTVDEGSGAVLAGSKTDPVKFIERWTFVRPVGNHPWRLSAIQQTE